MAKISEAGAYRPNPQPSDLVELETAAGEAGHTSLTYLLGWESSKTVQADELPYTMAVDDRGKSLRVAGPGDVVLPEATSLTADDGFWGTLTVLNGTDVRLVAQPDDMRSQANLAGWNDTTNPIYVGYARSQAPGCRIWLYVEAGRWRVVGPIRTTADEDFAIGTVPDGSVDNDKLGTIDEGRIKGRISSGPGQHEDLTAAQVRTILNVEDDADANPPLVTVVEAEEGALDEIRSWSPHRVAQAIAALATDGGAGGVALPVDDSTALVRDPVDSTKRVRIDVGLVPTGTTAVVTVAADVSLHPTSGTFAPLAHLHGIADITGLGTLAAKNALDAAGDITSPVITGQAEKASPVAADLLLLADSEAGNALRRVQVGNLPGGAGGDAAPAQNDATGPAYALDDTNAAYRNERVRVGVATDLEVAAAAQDLAWAVELTADVAVTVSVAGDAGSVQGTAGGAVSLVPKAGSLAWIYVRSNPGGAPVVWVVGDVVDAGRHNLPVDAPTASKTYAHADLNPAGDGRPLVILPDPAAGPITLTFPDPTDPDAPGGYGIGPAEERVIAKVRLQNAANPVAIACAAPTRLRSQPGTAGWNANTSPVYLGATAALADEATAIVSVDGARGFLIVEGALRAAP